MSGHAEIEDVAVEKKSVCIPGRNPVAGDSMPEYFGDRTIGGIQVHRAGYSMESPLQLQQA